MVNEDIKNIQVSRIQRENSPILGHAKIELSCGVLLNGIRIYRDQMNEKFIFLSFPTRKNNEGNTEKAYFPCNSQSRQLLTEKIHTKYLEVV